MFMGVNNAFSWCENMRKEWNTEVCGFMEAL